jgi:hypothetical protein
VEIAETDTPGFEGSALTDELRSMVSFAGCDADRSARSATADPASWGGELINP